MIKDSITSKRGRVFYWIERNPSDKCIVFIHGLTADHTLFDKQIDFWSRGYTVITLFELRHSMRGYPLTIIPNAEHNSNYDNYAEFNKIVDNFLKNL